MDKELKKDILNEEEILVEFDMETVLLGLGFIPVIGEAFDVILIIKYLKENRWIEALLMMVALIPTVGDAVVKPFLLAGRALKAFTGTAKFTKVLSQSPKFAAMYKRVGKYLSSPKVKALEKQIIKKNPELAGTLKKAETFHINALGKIKAGPVKKVLKKSGSRTGLGVGTQQLFRTKMLNKYAGKHAGALPKTALSNWYNIVYKGRKARRNAFRKLFLSSNLLGALGLPNIEAFEDYIMTDEGAEKVLNTPEFQELYNQMETQQNTVDTEPSQNTTNDTGGNLDGIISIPFLKQVAAALL